MIPETAAEVVGFVWCGGGGRFAVPRAAQNGIESVAYSAFPSSQFLAQNS